MAVVDEIVATWRGPARAFRRIVPATTEPQALAMLLGACFLVFVSQTPVAARVAQLEGQEVQAQIGIRFFATMFLLPLVLYALAALSHVVARALGGRGTPLGARVALFWSLLALAPALLLQGLVGGLVGTRTADLVTGGFVFAAFLLFWSRGLKVSQFGG